VGCIDENVCSAPVTKYLLVTDAPLVAIIAGGSRSVGEYQEVVLDASESGDDDEPDAELLASWTCEGDGDEAACPNEMSTSLVTDDPPLALPVGEYVFTVSVSKIEKPDEVASASVRVVVKAGAALPVATVTLPPGEKHDNTAKFAIAGEITPSPDVSESESVITYTWSAEMIAEWGGDAVGAVDLGGDTSATGSTNPNLVINPNILAAGGLYRFTLEGTQEVALERRALQATALVAFAQVEAQFNQPPFGGSLAVSWEGEGQAILDRYTMKGKDWQDPDGDLPLRYSFSYLLHGDAARTQVQSPQLSSSLSVRLPPGSITLIITVHDQIGAKAERNTTVTVPEVVLNTDQIGGLVEEELAAASSGEPEKALSTANAIVSVVNGQEMNATDEMDSRGQLMTLVAVSAETIPQDPLAVSSAATGVFKTSSGVINPDTASVGAGTISSLAARSSTMGLADNVDSVLVGGLSSLVRAFPAPNNSAVNASTANATSAANASAANTSALTPQQRAFYDDVLNSGDSIGQAMLVGFVAGEAQREVVSDEVQLAVAAFGDAPQSGEAARHGRDVVAEELEGVQEHLDAVKLV